MEFFTEKQKKRFKEVGSQMESYNPTVIAKIVDPINNAQWYITEYYPEQNLCYAYVHGTEPTGNEWQHISLGQLQTIKNKSIIIDPIFKEAPLSECIEELQHLKEAETETQRD